MELFKNNYYLKQNEMNFIKKNYSLIILKILLCFTIIFLKSIFIHKEKLINNRILRKSPILIPLNKYYINKFLKSNIFFNVTYFKFSFSFKYNIAKIEYNITFYDGNDNIIFPSDLMLYNNYQVICNITINN